MNTQRVLTSLLLAALPGCALSLDYHVGRADAGGDAGADVSTDAPAVCSEGENGCVAAPRQVAPLSTSTVTTRRPTLRWESADGAVRTRLELCRDRACTQVESAQDVSGGRFRVASDLAPGVHYWRMSSRSASDRVSVSSVWQFSVERRATPVDSSYGTMPDFDGDGLAEVLVGAPSADALLGEAYVYAGSRAGLSGQPSVTITSTDGPRSLLGRSITSAGDLDGDGYAEMVVGAYGVRGDTGRAYVYPGGPQGIDLARRITLVGPDVAGGLFGYFVSGVGDVNGDGYADLAVSAYGVNHSTGTVWIYHGGVQGVATTPSAQIDGIDGENGFFGSALAGGDLNGDGYADLVVGALGVQSTTGRAYVFPGGPTGVSAARRTVLATSDGVGEWFGRWVAVLGDVNGDGYPDLGVTEDHGLARPGRAWIYRGSASGVSDAARYFVTGDTGMSVFGNSIAGVGDVNGDGLDEVLVGEQGRAGGGSASLYLGGIEGIGQPGMARGRLPDVVLGPPDGPGSEFGRCVAGVNDVNGDGVPDIAVSADTVESSLGRVYVYYGSTNVVGQPSTRAGVGREADVTLRGRRSGGQFGWDVSDARGSARRGRGFRVYDARHGVSSGGAGQNGHSGGLRSRGSVRDAVTAAARGART